MEVKSNLNTTPQPESDFITLAVYRLYYEFVGESWTVSEQRVKTTAAERGIKSAPVCLDDKKPIDFLRCVCHFYFWFLAVR